jgi:hypothetical protein
MIGRNTYERNTPLSPPGLSPQMGYPRLSLSIPILRLGTLESEPIDASHVCLVYLVFPVYLVDLVDLVHPVDLIKPNKPNEPNEHTRLAEPTA